jgi:hypothetical protein
MDSGSDATATQRASVELDNPPEDGQTPKHVAKRDPTGTASSSNVSGNSNNSGAPTPTRQYKKVKKGPRAYFTETDLFLMALTHFHCLARNESWAPWANNSWLDHAPQYLLKRHPAESLRKHWNKAFAFYPRRDEVILSALKWSSGSNFLALARQNIMSSPMMSEWVAKSVDSQRAQETKLSKMAGSPSLWYCSDDMRKKQRTEWKTKGLPIPGEPGKPAANSVYSTLAYGCRDRLKNLWAVGLNCYSWGKAGDAGAFYNNHPLSLLTEMHNIILQMLRCSKPELGYRFYLKWYIDVVTCTAW